MQLVDGDDVEPQGADVGEGRAQEVRGDFEMVIGLERIAARRADVVQHQDDAHIGTKTIGVDEVAHPVTDSLPQGAAAVSLALRVRRSRRARLRGCGCLEGWRFPTISLTLTPMSGSGAGITSVPSKLGGLVLLGLLVTPSRLPDEGLAPLVVAVMLVLVARPLAVLACTTPFRLPAREQAFIAWAGLRGGVPIVFANISTNPTFSGGAWHFTAPPSTPTTGVIVLNGWGLPGPTGLGPGPPLPSDSLPRTSARQGSCR